MVHETDKKPNRNENPVGVQPESGSIFVKTYFASCLFSVLTNKAMQQETKTSKWKITYDRVIFSIQPVGSELRIPQSTVKAAMTPIVKPVVGTHSKSRPIETAASNICADPYSEEATPAICPSKLIQPVSQLIDGTQRGGARRETVKYRPPLVGYAETNSATDAAMHIHPAPDMSQHQTAEAEPPA